MKNSFLTFNSWIWFIAAILSVVVAILNFSQRAVYKLPATDGVNWQVRENGLFAEKIEPGSAADRAFMMPGDRLIAIGRDEKHFEEVVSPSDVQMYLEAVGPGGQLTYLFQRSAYAFDNNYYSADLKHLDSAPRWTISLFSLVFVGLVFLFVGFFVLFKQGGRAPFVLHFATLCLLAFVFLALKPIGTFEDFDVAVAILDDTAFILFAPTFLHFCLIYPIRSRYSEKKWQTGLLYLPAAILTLLSSANYLIPFSPALTQTIEKFDLIGRLYQIMLGHFIAYLVGGAGVLIYRFVRNKQIVVRQRIKWAMAGSVAAIAPIIIYQIVKFALGLPRENWLVSLSILPLAFIPLTLGHSVVRYRLMDVDIVVRRAAVYALTTLAISMLIGAVAFGFVYLAFGDLLPLVAGDSQAATETAGRILVAVVAMAAIVMLSAPLKELLQERADRFFYGERYDLRRGLLDFSKTLSATTHIDLLLNALISRLQQVLNVQKVAVLIEDERVSSGYRLARSVNLSKTFRVSSDFKQMIRVNSAENGIVRVDDLEMGDSEEELDHAFVRQELHYFVPCVSRGKMIAIIGLGRTNDGSLLSSEDIDILRTVSGYVAIAIENSLLYEEQQRRNEELALLKDFNESIVESVNVALLAVDVDGLVTRCNTTAEDLFGVKREDAVGQHVEELFAEDFAETLTQLLGRSRWNLDDVRHAYKLHAATRDGLSFISNIAIAPLRSPDGERTGAILVLEDVTSRISLEEQLQQREKLSSIGLLAAGVAHEVNTPLTGVSSYTQMLLSMIPESDPKHALLEKVKKQTERASNIVGNLLNFSRAGSSGDFVKLNVNKVLDDTVQLLEMQLKRSRIELVKNYESQLPLVNGNAGKLQQVFTNLILNAHDAILDRGQIKISTSFDDQNVIIEVADTGIGISPENLTKIYDPFFTTKEVGRGTGLGLAVSYGIIHEHIGRIEVESAPGAGTVFRINFPIAHAQTQVLQAAGD